MVERSVKVQNAHGIHARPAAEVVKVAARFLSAITIIRDDLEVNGKMLAAECGATIVIRAVGEDAEAAVDALVALVNARFGET